MHLPFKVHTHRYLGQSSEQTDFASSELRPWLKRAFPVTIPNTLRYPIINPAKMCTIAIHINHHWTLQGKFWPTQLYSDYDSCFHFCLIFLFKRFGFNLVVIYGIFNFLVCEPAWPGQGHNPGDGSENSGGTVYTGITAVTTSSPTLGPL